MPSPIPIEGLEEPALSVLLALRACRFNDGWHRHRNPRASFRDTLETIRRAAGPILKEWFRFRVWKSDLYDEAKNYLQDWAADDNIPSKLKPEIENALRDLEAASVGLWRPPEDGPDPPAQAARPVDRGVVTEAADVPRAVNPEDALLEVMQNGPPVALLTEAEVLDYVRLVASQGRLLGLRGAARPATGFDVRLIRKVQPGNTLAERLPREPVRLHFPNLRTVKMVCGKSGAWPDVREEVDQDLAEWSEDFCGVCVLVPASPLQGGRRIPHGNLPPWVRDRVSHRAFAPCPLEHYVDRMLEVGIAAPRNR